MWVNACDSPGCACCASSRCVEPWSPWELRLLQLFIIIIIIIIVVVIVIIVLVIIIIIILIISHYYYYKEG